MIVTTNMLLDELSNYANPKMKLARMVQQGKVFQIVKGLYETDKAIPGHLLAGSIYGPSYISFEYALGYHGLIPEAVYTVTNATFEKKKRKKYEGFLCLGIENSSLPVKILFQSIYISFESLPSFFGYLARCPCFITDKFFPDPNIFGCR